MSVAKGSDRSWQSEAMLARLARVRLRPWWQSVVLGLAFAAIALSIRWAAQAFYSEVTGFMILLPAVILAALAGGRVAGLAATAGCLFGGWIIAGPDAAGVGIITPMGRIATFNFVVVGIFVTVVGAALRTTLARLDQTVADLRTSSLRVDESESRFRTVADSIPNLAWMAERDGAIYWYNQRWFDYTGTTLEQMQGWGWQSVHDPDLVDGIRDRFAHCIQQGQPWEDTFPLRSAGGEWRWFLSRALPVRDEAGAIIRWFGTNTDITEQRQAEADLTRSEARFRTAVDAVGGIVWTNTPDGRMHGEQSGWARMTGQSQDDYQGYGWASAVHPDDAQPTIDGWNAAVAQSRTFQFEHRVRTATGIYRHYSVRAVPTLDAAGAILEWVGVHTDITEARVAEAALRESEERFRLMADTAPSPVWLTNAAGEVEFVNEALVRFYGKPGDAFLGLAWKATVHPDDLDGVNTIQADARTTFRPYGFECRFQRHDGVWRWMRVAVNPRFDGLDVFQGYVGLSFDITETREALDALARQERRQRFLLELADGVRELEDPQAIMDHVQSVLGRMLGVSRVGYGEISEDRTRVELMPDWTEGVASLVGQRILADYGRTEEDLFLGLTIVVDDVATDERTAHAVSAFEAIDVAAYVTVPLFRAGEMRSYLHIHASKPRHWLPEELTLIEDVAERTWSDVERARAALEVRDSEARFRAVADTAPVLIWVTNKDRSRAFVNQAYVDYMGGDYDTVRDADWRTHIHPDDQERLVTESLAGEATGQPFALEARYRHHSGEYRWLRSFSRPRLTLHGEIMGFVGVAFDVTDARRVEQDLKRINELLEDRVGEALAEKAKAEADLMHAQRMEAVGRLTGGVAHDFNNLLTVVIGALDLILKSPEDANRRQKFGEAALSAARRGERLTHQLLAFSRRQALRPEAIDINALIRESDPLLRRAVGEAVSYKLKLRRGGARVIVDPAQFEAALLNLIVNARDAVADKAATDGGIITVQTQSCEMQAGDVIDLAPGQYICITVSDTGVGMDAETMRRVFEPFFTTKSVGKGTGLGLSQVYGFARQSGGGIKIESTVGEGTGITLYLPPVTADEVVVPLAAPAKGTDVSGQSLLLVEDDTSVAAIAVDLLTSMGLMVEAVDNGPAALVTLAQRRFDIMLTDIVMPGGMTGFELARQAFQGYPAMRIVLTSGYAGDDVDAALADSPWPFIRKPYSAEQLEAALVQSVPAGA